MDFTKLGQDFLNLVITNAPTYLKAIILLWVGFKIANVVSGVLRKIFTVQKFDETLGNFLSSMIGWVIKIFVIIAVAGTLGIETTSFAAALGGSFLAIGVALQGTISHIASGFMILIFRPFKVGDTIVAQGHTGKVREIQLFSTIITTADNQTIIIPNGALSSGTTQNITFQPERRVDLSFTVNGTNFDEAKSSLTKAVGGHAQIKSIEIVPTAISAGSVTFAVRAWTSTDNHADVNAYILEAVKKASEQGLLSI